MRSRIPARVVSVLLLVVSALLAGCVGVGTTIASSVLSAAIKTAVEQSQNNKPSPEQMWHDAQIASLEHRAVNGDVEAQFQIGTYYLMHQEPTAERWICQAANQGHPKAQLQYGHWFNEDRKREDLFPFIGLNPDNVQAFVWYSLAANSGESRAPLFRDSLLSGAMTSQQVELARTRFASWTPNPCGYVQARTLYDGTIVTR